MAKAKKKNQLSKANKKKMEKMMEAGAKVKAARKASNKKTWEKMRETQAKLKKKAEQSKKGIKTGVQKAPKYKGAPEAPEYFLGGLVDKIKKGAKSVAKDVKKGLKGSKAHLSNVAKM